MGILPILVIVFSALNDILDFATAYFPGINEVITFMFASIIGMLVFFEALQKKLANEKGIGKMVAKKLLTLLAASLAESFPVFGLLPFQTIGAVVMGIIKTAPQKK
ncbi:MAG: hypothetical protein KBD19_03715 [Candidatus Moranbacteria bacterium]|jgi:hypothetical protein|nr:hypothetical protein [Candidatus Moranbacteria bacterium]